MGRGVTEFPNMGYAPFDGFLINSLAQERERKPLMHELVLMRRGNLIL